jgi:hypothetical protein
VPQIKKIKTRGKLGMVAEIGRIMVLGQPKEKVSEEPITSQVWYNTPSEK